MEKATSRLHKDMDIAEVVLAHPRAEKVIEKHFGGECSTCPGIKMESIAFGAMMHGMDPEAIVKELNKLE